MAWSKFRAGLRTVHLWAGLILSIPFVLLGLSGSALVLQPDVPRLSVPYAPGMGKHQSIETILKAANAAAPADMFATRIALPQRPGEPAAIRYTSRARARAIQNAGGINVYVDPVSAKVLGSGAQRRTDDFFQFARRLHATLYMDVISGRSVVGWTGIAWTLLLLSGLVLWWPKKGRLRAAISVKRGTRGFRLNRDLHGAFGIWTLLLLFLVGVSGIYLAFPQSFRAAVGTVLPTGQNFVDLSDTAPAEVPPGPALTLDEAVALATSAVPGTQVVGIQPPLRSGEITVLTLAPTRYGVGAPSALVTVEPDARRIAYIDDPRGYTFGERIIIWQRQIHSGLGFGILYRLLVFVSGFLPLLLGITGFRMWWLKRSRRRRSLAAEPLPAPAE